MGIRLFVVMLELKTLQSLNFAGFLDLAKMFGIQIFWWLHYCLHLILLYVIMFMGKQFRNNGTGLLTCIGF